MFYENENVLNHFTLVDFFLNEKNASIAYLYVIWMVEATFLSIAWIPGKEILFDRFTKLLSEAASNYLYENLTY